MSNVRELPREVALQGAEPRVARYRRLSPGPGAPHDQVLANQRSRICGAVIEIVAGDGYGALTVREIVRLAGVSTHTFYELFDDKDECFLETYRSIARCSAKKVVAAQRGCEDWEARLRRGFLAFTRELARRPDAARLALVEAFSGGEAARERMRNAMALYETVLGHGFAAAPDVAAGAELPLVIKGIVSGIARVSRMRLMTGRAAELPSIADALATWALSLRCPQAALAERLLAPAGRMPTGVSSSAIGRPGPHESDDRERILSAVVSLAAQDSRQQMTAPRIRAVAGVSRKSFDAYFKGVEDCLSTAARQLTERAFVRAARAGAQAPDWPRSVCRTVRELCLLIAGDPAYARLAFVEVLAWGPEAVGKRDATTGAIAQALAASAPPGQRPDALAADISLGAVWGLMHRFVSKGRSYELPRRAPVFAFLLLAPAIGGQATLEALAAEQGPLQWERPSGRAMTRSRPRTACFEERP